MTMVALASEMTVPYKYVPRDYQVPFLKAMDRGTKRAILVWHRRGGKDLTALQWTIKASTQRKGGYYYYFPTGSVGRKILWEGKTNDGFRFLDYFPPGSIARKNDTEMLIETVWGSHFRIIGTDNLDVVGTNPVGTVWSEFALQDPRAWQLVQPILRANDGWAVFCFTPRGHNHGYDLYQMSLIHKKEWFSQLLTIEDTGVIDKAKVEEDILSGVISEKLARQEYWCDWSLGQEGSYYGRIIETIRKEGRIGDVPHVASHPVHVSFDPGYTTALWCFQVVNGNAHFLRYWEDSGREATEYAQLLRTWEKEHDWQYGTIVMPWDADSKAQQVVTGSTGKTWMTTFRQLGFHVPAMKMERDVSNGIERTRQVIRTSRFSEEGCKIGIGRLSQYHERINRGMSTEDQPIFCGVPEKDGSEHGCLMAGTMISTPDGDRAIETIRAGDMVTTPLGDRKVTFSGLTKYATSLMKITTTSGRKLLCTPEHKIFTENGLVMADAIRYNTILFKNGYWRRLVWKLRLSLTDTDIGFREAITSGLVRPRCTKRSGSTIMDLCRMAIESITKTLTDSTTRLRTLSFYPSESMTFCTASGVGGSEVKPTSPSWSDPGTRRQRGTRAKREGPSIRPLPSTSIDTGQENSSTAQYAELSFQPTIAQEPSTVRQHVDREPLERTRNIRSVDDALFVGSSLSHSSIPGSERADSNVVQLWPNKPRMEQERALSVEDSSPATHWPDTVHPSAERKPGRRILNLTRIAFVKFVESLSDLARRFRLERVAGVAVINYESDLVPVYDLSVEKDHCYYAEGLLVSNSDAARYVSKAVRENLLSAGDISADREASAKHWKRLAAQYA